MKISVSRIFNRTFIIVLTVTVCIAADQATKFAAKKTLYGQGINRVIGDVLLLKYTENRGGFMGIGSNWPSAVRFTILRLLSVLIMAILIIYTFKKEQLKPMSLAALSLIIGGGITGLLERIIFNGYVIDFVNIGIGKIRTGIFNLADVLILSGIIIYFFSLKRDGKVE